MLFHVCNVIGWHQWYIQLYSCTPNFASIQTWKRPSMTHYPITNPLSSPVISPWLIGCPNDPKDAEADTWSFLSIATCKHLRNLIIENFKTKRHKLSLLFTSLTISTSLTFINEKLLSLDKFFTRLALSPDNFHH